MGRKKKLSEGAKLLLQRMLNGQVVIYRAVTGRAHYTNPGFGETDCTESLLELFKAGLVKVDKVDHGPGWAWYVPTEQAQGEGEGE